MDARSAVHGLATGGDDPAALRERFNILKSTYESRLRGLVTQLKDTLLRVQNDAGVQALAGDTTTASFVPVCAARGVTYAPARLESRCFKTVTSGYCRPVWMKSLKLR